MNVITVADAVGALTDTVLEMPVPKIRTLSFDMNKVINTAVREHNREVGSDRGPHDVMHVSEASYWCTARRVLDLICAKKGIRKMPIPIPAATQRIFDRGHVVHAMIQKWLGYTGQFYGDWQCLKCRRTYRYSVNPEQCTCGAKDWQYQELRVYHRLPGLTGILVGAVDGVFYHEGHWYLIEIKSKGSHNYSDDLEVSQPHYIQTNIYMHCLGIHRAIVCYADPEQGKIAGGGCLVQYDPAIWEWLYQRLAAAEQFALQGKIEPSMKACSCATKMLAKTCIHVEECFPIRKRHVRRVAKEH